MKAAVLYGNDDIRYEDVETPEPSKGQAQHAARRHNYRENNAIST